MRVSQKSLVTAVVRTSLSLGPMLQVSNQPIDKVWFKEEGDDGAEFCKRTSWDRIRSAIRRVLGQITNSKLPFISLRYYEEVTYVYDLDWAPCFFIVLDTPFGCLFKSQSVQFLLKSEIATCKTSNLMTYPDWSTPD